MSSSICPHFTQNAWKKDLCSNCFKSKDEHRQAAAAAAASGHTTSRYRTALSGRSNASLMSKLAEIDHKKTDYPNRHKTPVKSIIKVRTTAGGSATKTANGKRKSHRVSFPKVFSEVIGYGGEWSDADSDDDDDHDFMNLGNERDDNAATSTDDEETLELKRITRANTDFNMNNGNLLGDPQENIKKSFAALKLGAPQVDKEGKKQTLKINVVPFGAAAAAPASISTAAATASVSAASAVAKPSMAAAAVKTKFEAKSETEVASLTTRTTSTATTTTTTSKSEKVATKQNITIIKSLKKLTPTITMSSTTTTTKATALTAGGPAKTVTAAPAYAQQKQDASSGDSDGKNSPPIERAMEKSLLDEISETLEQQKTESKKLAAEKAAETTKAATMAAAAAVPAAATHSKIKFEISSLTESMEHKQPFLDLKKPIARNPPITKDHTKPKINVFHKYSDTDSNCSDSENGVSAYYDVVETQLSYENLPDGKSVRNPKDKSDSSGNAADNQADNNKALFSSSQYITDMLLSSKTRAASYNLHEGNFMTSKITSDGLIVTKCSSDDALDSTGSSFDGSSDEETSYNMTRSESDSGIGISIGSDYKNIAVEKERERLRIEKKLSASTNNSDYEDIQVTDQRPILTKTEPPSGTFAGTHGGHTKSTPSPFSLEKSRELHGEPDGSADPDGSLENKEPTASSTHHQAQKLPALPKSPPPTKLIDARPSFLHGLQKQHPPISLKKPELPAKPVVSPTHTPMKTFMAKRQTANSVEQQVINQLQLVMSKSSENLSDTDAAKDDAKLKKGRAPNPPPEQKSSAPPTPERDYNITVEFEFEQAKQEEAVVEKAADGKQPSAIAQPDDGKPETEVGDSTKRSVRAEVDKTSANNNNTVPTATPTTSDVITPQQPPATSFNLYTRKLPATTSSATNAHSAAKNTSSPVIREKDKRERATVNPKFRSLNTFVTQRSNAAKNQQLSSLNVKQPMTPEPMPKSHKNQLSLSEECLTPSLSTATITAAAMSASTINLTLASGGEKHKNGQHPTTVTATATATPTTPASAPKTKTKFSIKKFLRMGASKTTDNMHKKDAIYSEICTGDETNVVGKPRLVIIHPIDINPTAVEVVKDITKTSDAVAAQTVAVVTAKPPAPPLRVSDGQRAHELNKPARPPPPKSVELRRKQNISLSPTASVSGGSETSGSLKCKADNVYANLGEIRSSIAPRKPERTASMREREAQLELARKRHVGASNENTDTISICSSNDDNVSVEQQSPNQPASASAHAAASTNKTSTQNSTLFGSVNRSTTVVDGKPPTGSTGSRTTTFERSKSNDPKVTIANKLEIFENRSAAANNNDSAACGAGGSGTNDSRPSSLKDSVRKINSTIDSYLKDKREYENMYEFVKGPSSPSSPPPPPTRSVDLSVAGQRLLTPRRNNIYSDTASIASYTRSEYGPARSFGLNNSLANIPRVISASYCGSEVGEFDIYSPYSYYGSEAGGDVANDINDSVWGIPSAIKSRSKATNRLRMRKGRSVVHKTIEDNYTAVVVANHEALAQVLDQLQQTPVIPAALRPLANAINLRFEDFAILEGAQAFVVGKKAFHSALWTTAPVTLALSADCNQLSGVGGELSQLSGGVSGVLNPITEFCDLVPSYHLPLMPSTAVTLLQATISVLPRLQLETLQSIGAILKSKSQVLDKSNFNFRGSIPNLSAGLKDNASSNALRNVVSVQNLSTLNEESALDRANDEADNNGESTSSTQHMVGMPAFDDVMTREVAFIMLQLVNGMKNLQAKAIEEMPLSLSNVVLSKDVDNKDAQARLCVLQGNNNDEDEAMGTLCKCAHLALSDMLPSTKITPILADILTQERAESLSKSKAVLEFILWGPSDVVLSGSTKERELALQRWLDLERATVLHGLVRTRVELTVYDECHLMFLVRSTAKMMNDAAKIVFSYQQSSALSGAAVAMERQD